MSSTSGKVEIGIEERELMAERARALAVPPTAETERELVARVLVVTVGQEHFGVPVNWLKEMIPVPPITPLPGLPPWMPGVANARSGVVSVVDLGRWFGIAGTRATPTHLVLVEGAPGLLALGVEGGGALRDIHDDEVAPSLAEQQFSSDLPIRATTNDLLTVLDLQALFDSAEIYVGQPRPTDMASAT